MKLQVTLCGSNFLCVGAVFSTKISGHQKQDSPVEKQFIECYDTAHKLEEDKPDSCRWVEKVMTVYATDVNKLKPQINTRDEEPGRELTPKI